MPVTANPRSGGHTSSRSAPRAYPDMIGVLGGRAMEAVPDNVLLSAVLTMAEPGVDGDALAARLLSGQRTLEEAAVAVVQKTILVDELDAQASVRLQALVELAARLVRPSLAKHPVFLEHAALVTYCRLRAACVPVQQVRTIFLDARKHLIADEVHQTGTVNEVKTYVREIIRRALELGACGLVVAQSAPGDEPPKPWSAESVCADLQRAGAALGVELHDYLVIGRRSYRSLSRRDADERVRKTRGNGQGEPHSMSQPEVPHGR